MKIESVELKRVSIPLKKPFKTALRRVDTAENIIVVMTADDGTRGYGEAPPTAAITGDTDKTIISAIKKIPLLRQLSAWISKTWMTSCTACSIP